MGLQRFAQKVCHGNLGQSASTDSELYDRSGSSDSLLSTRVVALARFLATKHFRVARWCAVSYGNILIISLLGLFFLGKPRHPAIIFALE